MADSKVAGFIAFLVCLCFGALTTAPKEVLSATNTASDQQQSLKLQQYRERFKSMLKADPFIQPNNENLYSIRPSFPALHAFSLNDKRAKLVLLQDEGVIREGYESSGILYFALDRSPAMGIHDVGFYTFGNNVSSFSLGPSSFQGLFFTHIDSTRAILEGYDHVQPDHNYFWLITNGTIKKTSGPGDPVFVQQTKVPPTCSISRGSVLFNDRQNPITITPTALSLATHGIALQAGITIGCRRIGDVDLLWLTADQNFQDGVTFEVKQGMLHPLFVGHPYIQTQHFLVFTQYDTNGDSPRKYLFIRDATVNRANGVTPGLTQREFKIK